MSKQSYAITIKVIKRDTESNEQDLKFYFDIVTKRHAATEIFYVYERDSKNRLHLHGEFIARKGIRYNLVKIPYVHIHITPLPTYEDECQWYDYCHKEDVKDFVKRCVSEYMFVDRENAGGIDDPCDE